MPAELTAEILQAVSTIVAARSKLDRADQFAEQGLRTSVFDLVDLLREHPHLFEELPLEPVEVDGTLYKVLTRGPCRWRYGGEAISAIVLRSGQDLNRIRELIWDEGKCIDDNGWAYGDEHPESHRHARNVIASVAGALAAWAEDQVRRAEQVEGAERASAHAQELIRAVREAA
jgi:hypothetical protein